MSSQTLPLFPLHSVLFPHMPISLQVFEERYKQMISRCVEDEQPFGVVLIKEGVEVGGTPVPESVGTIASIHAIEPFEGGRFKLFAEGSSRFQILDIDSSKPYLIGTVDLFNDEPTNLGSLKSLSGEIRIQFDEYFDILVGYAGVDMPRYDLPQGDEELSFVIAAVVEADMAERQSFLEMRDTRSRMQRLQSLLSADVKRLRLATERSGSRASELPATWKQAFISRN